MIYPEDHDNPRSILRFGKSFIVVLKFNGLRRNDAPSGNQSRYHKNPEIIHYSLPKFPLIPLPLLPVPKKRLNNYFLQLNQGNEQLRIDGDFYPCAI